MSRILFPSMLVSLSFCLAAPTALAGVDSAAGTLPSPSGDLLVAWADDDTTTSAKKGAKGEEEEEEEDSLDFGGDGLELDVFNSYDDETPDEEIERLKDADVIGAEPETETETDEYGGDQEQEILDFTEDDEEVPIGGPGQDSARIYRAFMDKMEDLGPDEEVISWERYLDQYPKSLFKDRIQSRVEELQIELFDERVSGSMDLGRSVDAGRREIELSAPLTLESIDPRTKLELGFEWGFPDYRKLLASFEYQILRNFSAIGTIRNRYTGLNAEAGAHWAFIKSARTNTIVSLLGDLHINTDPFFFGVRPQLAAGKRLLIKGQPLDLQIQAGPDIELRPDAPIGMRAIGGAAITYQPTDTVRMFFETNLNMKNLFWEEGGSFRYNTIAFGLTFIVPTDASDLMATLFANAPYTSNYWNYHYGAVGADFKYYME